MWSKSIRYTTCSHSKWSPLRMLFCQWTNARGKWNFSNMSAIQNYNVYLAKTTSTIKVRGSQMTRMNIRWISIYMLIFCNNFRSGCSTNVAQKEKPSEGGFRLCWFMHNVSTMLLNQECLSTRKVPLFRNNVNDIKTCNLKTCSVGLFFIIQQRTLLVLFLALIVSFSFCGKMLTWAVIDV